MDETKSGMSWVWVLFVIIVIFAVFGGGFGGGFGNGWGNNGRAVEVVNGGGWNGCSRVSPCEIEKQEIIDSARTQYQIEQQGAATRAAVAEGTAEITAQNNRIYIQNLQESIFDLKMENQQLKSNIFTKDQTDAIMAKVTSCCCDFNRRLDGIEDRMLTRPNLYGVASTCSGQVIPNSLWSNCGSGCNNF